MDAKDQGQRAEDTNGICRLEWIAWAIDAARRHKEDEQRAVPPTVAHPRVAAVPEPESAPR
jgi:hypothetical protein